MRTTVNLDEDVAAAVAQLRRQRSLGLSEAVNELARAGLLTKPSRASFHQRTAALGIRLDVTNVAEALELLEPGPPL
ncbi:MAG: CopG family transcriptional regulator [Candidatus Dormibacteria bacterium]